LKNDLNITEEYIRDLLNHIDKTIEAHHFALNELTAIRKKLFDEILKERKENRDRPFDTAKLIALRLLEKCGALTEAELTEKVRVDTDCELEQDITRRIITVLNQEGKIAKSKSGKWKFVGYTETEALANTVD
jgi:DNA-binding transcriptional ArsR family regulator